MLATVPGIGVALGSPMRVGSRLLAPWLGAVLAPLRAPLATDARAEVCVIGAGIAGLPVAYELACEGRSVIVLGDGSIGDDAGRTTAHVCARADQSYVDISRTDGVDAARAFIASHMAAIDRMQTIVATETLDCDVERLDAYFIGGGRGVVVRRGLSKIALYRDPAGVLHQRSAICPHLGCAVSWYDAERTWDCRCHGSRFGPDGDLLMGPAAARLGPPDPPEADRRAS